MTISTTYSTTVGLAGDAAGDTSIYPITVTVKDTSNLPVAGVTVTLACSGTGNTIVQPVGVTGADGKAYGSIASTVAESKTVTATANATVLTSYVYRVCVFILIDVALGFVPLREKALYGGATPQGIFNPGWN